MPFFLLRGAIWKGKILPLLSLTDTPCFAKNLCNADFNSNDVVRAARITPNPKDKLETLPVSFYVETAKRIISHYGMNETLTQNSLDGLDELRNDYLQENLANIMLVLIGVIAVLVGLRVAFKKVKKLSDFKAKVATIKKKRWFVDLFVGFRLIKKPNSQ